jgi:serine/threonine-protein kinase
VDPQSSKLPWERIEALFPDLLALSPARRAAFLDRHCAGNTAMRDELESLLTSSQRDSVLDHPPLLDAAETAEASPPLHADERFNAWRIVRLLGRGGMGEVYLAERVDGGFAQTAAIKRLRVDAIEHAERFDAERSIVAQLDHPHIARLLDGGIGADGRAWMAMEYVEGANLSDYCRSQALDLDARIALFEQICAAVAYAHVHLVVHRDIKPSNILVTSEGQAKLLDFGIARLLEREGETNLTRTAPLTPDHAAPEQLEGGAATTAVDIYTLGVLLYEMLSGKRPWATGNTPISLVVDRLLREEPQPPSRAAGDDSPVPSKQLRGDLDAIVQRCMRKAPGDRYPTVDALRADLQRWRAHHPVEARRGSTGYAFRRWLWRHRFGVAATVLLFIVLLGGLGAALWQAQRAQHQAWRAERVKELVLSAFREQDPLSRPDAKSRTPAELVSDGIAAIDHELKGDPALHAELLDDFGEIQGNLGDLPNAQLTLQRALDERLKLHGTDHLAVVETQRKLALILLKQRDMDRAMTLAERSLAALQRLKQQDSPEAAQVKLVMAMVMVNRKQREAALQLGNEAAKTLEAVYGPDDPRVVDAYHRAAQALIQLRRDDEAETVIRDVVSRIERSQGADSPRLVMPLVTLASVLKQAQRGDDADAVFERAIALTRKSFGLKHYLLGTLLARQANLRMGQGRPQEALALFTEAEPLLGEDDLERGNLLTARGRTYIKLKRYEEGERDLHAAFEFRRKSMGEDAGIAWYSASQWGTALRKLGRLDEAEQIQRQALQNTLRILGPDGYQNVLLMDELAATLTESGKHDEAIVLAERSFELTGKTYSSEHPLVAERLLRLASALALSAGADARVRAVDRCDQALGIYRSMGGEWLTGGLLACGGLNVELRNFIHAREMLQEALARLDGAPAGDPQLLKVQALLAKTGDG